MILRASGKLVRYRFHTLCIGFSELSRIAPGKLKHLGVRLQPAPGFWWDKRRATDTVLQLSDNVEVKAGTRGDSAVRRWFEDEAAHKPAAE